MIPGWLVEASRSFWAGAVAPPFPRDLDQTLPFHLPLATVPLPALALDAIAGWLVARGLCARLDEPNRHVRGGLVAFADTGVLFVDGGDLPAERCFTVAHEAAHFLLDYQQPRARALRLLGPSILPVLDGERSPSRAERLDAALTDCPLGLHVHLLDRRDPTARIARIEDRADQLACELLAPAEELARHVAAGGGSVDPQRLAEMLVGEFGLPAAEAGHYARRWLRGTHLADLAAGLWS
jgi:hypothetical protein